MISTCLIVTDCDSAQKLKMSEGTAQLPLEIVYMIVDFALDHLKRTQDGSLVAALMHTSSLLRFRAVKAFTPIQVYECPVSSAATGKLYFPASAWLHAQIWGAVQAFFSDFSTKRYSKERAFWPSLNDEVGKEVIASHEGMTGAFVNCEVLVDLDGEEWTQDRDDEEIGAGEVTASRVASTVQLVLDRLAFSNFNDPEDEEVTECPKAPQFANAHQRALGGTLSSPSAGASITVMVAIRSRENPSETFRRTFQFDTLKVRKST